MRTRTLVTPLLALAVLAGCGDRRLDVRVDALSFTNPAARSYAFGPVPPLPVPVVTGEVAILDDLPIHLVSGAGSLVGIDAVTITAAADVQDSTGSGLDTLRVYLSDASVDPRTTPPVLVAPVVLTPGAVVAIHSIVAADSRVAALFSGSELRATVTTSFEGPTSGQSLSGHFTLTALTADIVARRGRL